MTAVPYNARAVVSFTVNPFTGGFAPTLFTVTASPGGATASGAGSPITVTGLTNAQLYSFSGQLVDSSSALHELMPCMNSMLRAVTATNAVGVSAASNATALAQATPTGTLAGQLSELRDHGSVSAGSTVADAPTGAVATLDSTWTDQASVSFTAPTFIGGGPILRYQVILFLPSSQFSDSHVQTFILLVV